MRLLSLYMLLLLSLNYCRAGDNNYSNDTHTQSPSSSLTSSKTIILRPDIAFNKQVIYSNTIYVVQHVFDLNNQEVTLPAGCTLEFNGGRIINGTIISSTLDIAPTRRKIFDNIKFKGNCALNTNFYVLWFVENYIDHIADNVKIDSSPELNAAFASGAKNFIFPSDVFFYLKNTIKVIGDINIYSDRTGEVVGRGPWGVNHECCVYSNEIITLLDYTFSTREQSKGLTIEGINFYCRKPYANLKDKNTPIVRITSNKTEGACKTIWGLIFNCDISSKLYDINIGSNKGYVPSYTGLELFANTGSITFITIRGYLQEVYTGIRLKRNKNNETWITDLTIEANTQCVYGGDFRDISGGPVNIYGSHQPRQAFATTEDSSEFGYFYGKWINLYGFVWDCATKQKAIKGDLYLIKYPYTTESDWTSAYSGSTTPDYISYDDLDRSSLIITDKLSIPSHTTNLLGNCNEGVFVSNLSYKCNGVDIFNNSNVKIYNSHNLFGNSLDVTDNTWRSNVYGDGAYIENLTTKSLTVVLQVEFDISNAQNYAPANRYIDLYFRAFGELDIRVIRDGKEYVTNKFDNIGYYNNRLIKVRHLFDDSHKASHVIIKNKFVLKSKGAVFGLPFIYLPSPVQNSIIHKGSSKLRPIFNQYNNHSGFVYFDTDLNRQVLWNGNDWVGTDGLSLNNSGPTKNRPKVYIKAGFIYKDTDINELIIWDGEFWRDLKGNIR